MSILRRLATLPFRFSTTLRAPKKKKQQVVVDQSGDVVNIFKDRTQQPIRDIFTYPLFVQYYAIGDNIGMRQAEQLRSAASEGDRFAHPLPVERRRFVRAYKKKQKRKVNELVHERRNKYQNFDNQSLTPGLEDPHFPNLFGDLQKYEEEQRKKELEEQLALDDESEEEEGGKGAPRGRG